MKSRLLLWLLLLSVNVANAQLIGAGRRGVSGSGSITETDPTVPANVKAINSGNISQWNSALTPSSTATLTNKTMSGVSNTFSNIPYTALSNPPVIPTNVDYVDRTTSQLVAGNKELAGTLALTNSYANYQAIFGQLTGNAARVGFRDGAGTVAGVIGYGSASSVTEFQFRAGGQSSFVNGGSSSMTIFPDGNILAQTGGTATNAGYKLDVQGTSRLSGTTTTQLLVPSANVTYDIGSTAARYANVWTGQVVTPGALSIGSTAVSNAITFRQGSASQISGGFNTDGSYFLQAASTLPTSTGQLLQVNGSTLLGGTVRTTGASSVSSTGQLISYNTVDETTNYERAYHRWIAGVYTIGTEQGGTGAGKDIKIGPGLNLSAAGLTSISRSSSAANTAIMAMQGVLSHASTNIGYGINNSFTVNQTTSAGYTAYYASIYEQGVGSGSKLLIDLGTNTAANNTGTHTSKFTVSNTGRLNFADAPVYADNGAATTAGLPVGTVYRTSTGVLMIRY